MKVCVSVQGESLDAAIEPRFGRTEKFLLVDSVSMAFEVIDNNATDLSQGAGITAAKNVIDSGAKVVLTGNCGPKAFRTLQAGNIAVYTGLKGTVQQAIDQFISGSLTANSDANVESHFGSV